MPTVRTVGGRLRQVKEAEAWGLQRDERGSRGGVTPESAILSHRSQPRRPVVQMLEYSVEARRIDAHGSRASCKAAEVVLDTDVNGRPDAFNPAELFLASIAACMLKGIERAIPMLKFDLRGAEVRLRGVRQDSPPRMVSVTYDIIVDTDEEDRRLDLLHTNVRKFGTIYNTVSAATKLDGTMRRKS
jgi:uncharacterized OsmC-like protein